MVTASLLLGLLVWVGVVSGLLCQRYWEGCPIDSLVFGVLWFFGSIALSGAAILCGLAYLLLPIYDQGTPTERSMALSGTLLGAA